MKPQEIKPTEEESKIAADLAVSIARLHGDKEDADTLLMGDLGYYANDIAYEIAKARIKASGQIIEERRHGGGEGAGGGIHHFRGFTKMMYGYSEVATHSKDSLFFWYAVLFLLDFNDKSGNALQRGFSLFGSVKYEGERIAVFLFPKAAVILVVYAVFVFGGSDSSPFVFSAKEELRSVTLEEWRR